MDLHPIFVHFPIALLTIYASMELVRFKTTKSNYWFYTKASLLLLGGVSILLAASSGEEAEEMNVPALYQRDIVQLHSFFANASIAIFGLLAAWYVFVLIERNEKIKSFIPGFAKWLPALAERIYASTFGSIILILSALLGLALITITGGLGGLMVHGPNTDPLTKLLYNLISGF